MARVMYFGSAAVTYCSTMRTKLASSSSSAKRQKAASPRVCAMSARAGSRSRLGGAPGGRGGAPGLAKPDSPSSRALAAAPKSSSAR